MLVTTHVLLICGFLYKWVGMLHAFRTYFCSFSAKCLKTHLTECFKQLRVIIKASLSLSFKVMALDQSKSKLNPIISGWTFEIDMEAVSHLNVNG